MAWSIEPFTSPKDAYLARVEGVVDSTNVEDFFSLLNAAFKKGAKVIIIDLSELSYISSGGLSVLVDAYKKAVKAGGTMVVFGVNDLIKESFEAVGLEKVIPFADSLDEALDEAKGVLGVENG